MKSRCKRLSDEEIRLEEGRTAAANIEEGESSHCSTRLCSLNQGPRGETHHSCAVFCQRTQLDGRENSSVRGKRATRYCTW